MKELRERPHRRERAQKQQKMKKPYEGSIVGFLKRPVDAFGLFLIAGLLWSVLSMVVLVFVLTG